MGYGQVAGLCEHDKLYMIHDPCIIQIYRSMVPTNEHMYIKISLYTQCTPICFGQPRGNLQGFKIQRPDKLEVQNKIIKVSEPIQKCYAILHF